MSQRRLWVAAGIIALVILAGFTLYVPHTRDSGAPQASVSLPTAVPSVTVRDSYKKGVHTITGSLEVPNACTGVLAVATTTGDGIHLAISTQADTGVCLQLPARATFTATIAAPQNLPITATVNNASATVTS